MFTQFINLNQAEISGFPIGLHTFGLDKIAEDGRSKTLAGNLQKPDFLENGAVSTALIINGKFIGSSADENPLFVAEVVSSNPIYKNLAYLKSASRDASTRTANPFTRNILTISGDSVKLKWTLPDLVTVPDFKAIRIYWDAGITNLNESQFIVLSTVANTGVNFFIKRNLESGDYRFYITFLDIYGNEGDVLTPDTVSATIFAPPTLAGGFSITFTTITFTPTAQANVVSRKMFLNYIFGVGVVDYINYETPVAVSASTSLGTLSYLLPVGNLRVAVVGYDLYGNPTEPLIYLVTITVDGYVLVLAPKNVLTETLAAGYFNLQFDDLNTVLNWITGRLEIYQEDQVTLETTLTFPSSSVVPVLLFPDIADGVYYVKLRLENGADVSAFSDFAYLLIDSTYPSGSETLEIEVL